MKNTERVIIASSLQRIVRTHSPFCFLHPSICLALFLSLPVAQLLTSAKQCTLPIAHSRFRHRFHLAVVEVIARGCFVHWKMSGRGGCDR